MSELTADDIKQLVNSQLNIIEDELVRSTIEGLLIDPFSQNREWHGHSYPCWAVADHIASDTRFVYCEEDYGLPLRWGVVSASGLEMGMDSNWFETLEQAFYDSFAAVPLRIWNVVKRNTTGSDRVVASALTSDKAMELIAKLNRELGAHPYSWATYCMEPRMKIWW